MKKLIALLLCLLTVGALAGCGGKDAPAAGVDANTNADDQLRIVTTIFPEYDWVREILGDKAGDTELTMLLDNGVDLHSYQPSAEDMLTIADCDLFIYVGGESDSWVDDALRFTANDNRKIIKLLDVLGERAKEEEMVEGMEEEADEHADEHDDENHEEHAYDEHVWLSLKNAETLCSAIAGTLGELDPANKAVYDANLAAYTQKLKDMDSAYQQAVDAAARKTVLFGDRFPFRYLADDYGLRYYAAFVGCSAETEASFETVTFLAQKVDELQLPRVLTIEGTKHKIAETVVANTAEKNQEVVAMDSMQAIMSDDVANGVTYLGVMEKNLDVLKAALN